MELRPYQKECIESIREGMRRGVRKQLISLPTGSGKTVIFANIAKNMKEDTRMLILAHREELINQAVAKLVAADRDLQIGVERANSHAFDEKIIVASVPTLRGKRLNKFKPNDFKIIVIDEAHRSLARTYSQIVEYFTGCKILLGFTATPFRSDKQKLDSLFEETIYEKTIEEMINEGHLCRLKGYSIDTGENLGSVKMSGGDYNAADLEIKINTWARNDRIVKAYLDKGENRQCIAFCSGVNHSRELAKLFNANNVYAAAITGDMSREERAYFIKLYMSGYLKVLTNFNVLTEGFDAPKTAIILMARPTKSTLVYTQAIGRGTRNAEGKTDCIIMDFLDEMDRPSLSIGQLFGGARTVGGKDVIEEKIKLEKIKIEWPELKIPEDATMEDVDKIVQEYVQLELFKSKPTEKQLNFLRYNNVEIPVGLTKRWASSLIGRHINKWVIKKA